MNCLVGLLVRWGKATTNGVFRACACDFLSIVNGKTKFVYVYNPKATLRYSRGNSGDAYSRTHLLIPPVSRQTGID